MRIIHPQFLFLLLLIAGGLYLVARRQSSYRPWLHFAVRLLVAAALVLGAAGVEVRRPDYSLERFFLLDISDSTGIDAAVVLEQVGHLTEKMHRRDRVSVIALGRDPSSEFGPGPPASFALEHLSSSVDGSCTDLEAALALARSQHRKNASGQIVLISDGNETAGEARREILRLAAEGLPVYCVPVERKARDLRVRFVEYPQSVRPGEIFRMTAEVTGTGQTRIAARTDEGEAVDDTLVVAGRKLWRAELSLRKPGLHRVEAVITPPGDPIAQNNQCAAAVWVPGPASLLWVSDGSSSLAEVAADSGFTVSEIVPSQLPWSAAGLQGYDAVIIEDRPAWAFSQQALAGVNTYVGRMGGGLIMLGGSKAFGPGGYIGTPVEAALPVECDPQEQTSKPLALAVAVDRSGSMAEKVSGRSKLSFAQEGVLHVIEQLKDEDRIAVVAFHGVADVVMALGKVAGKEQLTKQVLGLDAHGTTDLNAPLGEALKRLEGVGDDALKHVILLSDGLSKKPVDEGWGRKFAAANISVSVVATGEKVARKLLKSLSDATGGTFYSVDNIADVPDILAREARPSTSKLLRQSAAGFAVGLETSPLTRGLTDPPAIAQYALVKAKETAETAMRVDEGSALLAAWRFGAGRSAAFAAPAGCLADWQDAGALWAHVIAWVVREAGDTSLTTTITVEKGIARIEVADPSGELKDYRATVVRPSGEAEAVRLRQIAPNLYGGEFPVDTVGVYPVSIVEHSDTRTILRDRAAAVLSYSPEWSNTQANLQFLAEMSRATGGSLLEAVGELPAPDDGGAGAFDNVSWLPALVALILFLIDLAIS